jgi:hypothetical protein
MPKRRPEKRQIFIGILASFLIYGLIWYGLSPTITKPIQGEPFSSSLPEKMPLHDEESYPVSLPLWQVNESNNVFAQIVAGTGLCRVTTKSSGNVRSALCYCCHNTDSSHADISLHIIDSISTVFTFINGQAYQHLDIPPPHALASL